MEIVLLPLVTSTTSGFGISPSYGEGGVGVGTADSPGFSSLGGGISGTGGEYITRCFPTTAPSEGLFVISTNEPSD